MTIICLLIIVLLCIGITTVKIMDSNIRSQNSSSIMDLAYTIASMDEIKENLYIHEDHNVIQSKVEEIRKNTRFQYIIVLDMDGVRFSYPNPHGVGKAYKDSGADEALQKGLAYVRRDNSRFISAIWGAVPVYYSDKQVGAVLVGLLDDTVEKSSRYYIIFLCGCIFFALIVGGVIAWSVSKSIKKSIFGLEPEDISSLMGQRDLILHSLNQGIICVDKKGNIEFLNDIAKIVLKVHNIDQTINILEINNNLSKDILQVLEMQETMYNQEVKIDNNKTLMCSYKILKNHKEQIVGVLTVFEDLTQVKEMAENLTGVKKITDSLRAQHHEFSNKLYTISGLIQLEEYDKALNYITDISTKKQNINNVLNNNINYPHLSALLLSKTNRATEAKIKVVIDENSKLDRLPKSINIDELCSIVGNLFENSIEALLGIENKEIYIKIYSGDKFLDIIVKNDGPEIDKESRANVFEKGFTTKNGSRGYGLNIIKNIIDYADGTIKLISHYGTEWHVKIPMKRV